jgi:hypothetical protein
VRARCRKTGHHLLARDDDEKWGLIDRLTRAHGLNGARFSGPKLNGIIPPGGDDWLLRRPEGAASLDVRVTLQTDDDALI